MTLNIFTLRDQEVLTDEFETTEEINPMKYLYYGGLVGIPEDQYQWVKKDSAEVLKSVWNQKKGEWGTACRQCDGIYTLSWR